MPKDSNGNGRVLSGMRPSGKLHLGHLHGVLDNWLELQEKYDCFFFVADWHALTTEYANPRGIKSNVPDMVIDWLSVGIDPALSTIFCQSDVKEHAELYVLLSMYTPLGWLERNPTYKEQLEELKSKDIRSLGFLGYPVLQTADIIIYKADKVPVGADQAPHIELSREITRRFNHLTNPDSSKGNKKGNNDNSVGIFPEPETLLTKAAKVLGTDGRKMSKSYDNSIYISDDADTIDKKIRTMVTDTARQKKTDPGDPKKCPMFETFHELYSDEETKAWAIEGCTKATIGCIECKKAVIPKVLERMEPIHKRRAELIAKPDSVTEILTMGAEKAREVAGETMSEVRKALGL